MQNQAYLPLLIDLLLKSAGLLLAGGALLATLRRTSAANRHAVSSAIFAALLLLPLTELSVPRWSLSVGKSAVPTVNVRLPLIVTERAEAGRGSEPSETNFSPGRGEARLDFAWPGLALAVWISGAALLLGRRVCIALWLRAVVRGSREINDPRLAAMAREIVAASGVVAEVRQSVLCPVPLVAGIARPVVLLPVGAEAWPESLIVSALRHELGHILRRDCHTRALVDAVCALYWMNPLVWIAARQLRLLQEQACDDLVLNSGVRPDAYAEQLVDVARSLQSVSFTTRQALSMAQPSTLETRVRAIVDTNLDRRPRSLRSVSTAVAFAAAALALSSAAQLRGAEGKKAGPDGEIGAPTAQQVTIEAKFIEVPIDDSSLPDILKSRKPKASSPAAVILSGKETNAAIRALNKVKGVDLVSCPRVTTRSKQNAKIEIVREFRYANAWRKDAKTGAWIPSDFAERDIGVTCDVTPEVKANGDIALQMTPAVVEVAGFVDMDGDVTKVFGNPPASKSLLDATNAPGAGLEIPKGHRWKPVFDSRTIKTTVSVPSGMTVVLSGMKHDGVHEGTGESRRKVFVFVTARIAEPDKAAAVQASPDKVNVQ